MSSGRNKTFNITLPFWASRLVEHLARLTGATEANVIRSLLSDYLVSSVLREDFKIMRVAQVISQYGASRGRQSTEKVEEEQQLFELAQAFLTQSPLPTAAEVEQFNRGDTPDLGEKPTNLLILRERVGKIGSGMAILAGNMKSCASWKDFREECLRDFDKILNPAAPTAVEPEPPAEDEEDEATFPCPECEFPDCKIVPYESGDPGEMALHCEACNSYFDEPTRLPDHSDADGLFGDL